MAVTQTLRALGSWDVQLREDTPAEVWDRIDYFGHVAIHMGRQNPQVARDSLLKSARYVGVLRSRSESGLPKKIGGVDISMWLGDPDNKSDIVESELVLNGTFQTVINAVMAGFDAIQIGTVFNDPTTFTGTFQFQTRRQIIDYICQTLGGFAWRVNGDATIDAGREEDLFVTVPEVAVIRKQKALPSLAGSEADMFLRSLGGQLDTAQDVEDLTTRVLLMAQGSNGQFVSAAVDAPPGTHPYLDMFGNPIKMTRIAQESETNESNAEARAQLLLNRFLGTRDALNLTTDFYDISGVARVGDYLWVYDPVMNLIDPNNEVIFRGQRMNPFRLQMTETTWPVSQGMSVFYRHYDGDWIDLTDFVVWESGATNIVVGGYNRSLNDSGTGVFPITPPEADNSVPDIVVWDLPWSQAMYQNPMTGESKSEVELKWLRPDNIDGSTITDGAYYEFRWRQSTVPLYSPTIGELASYELSELDTVGAPIELGIEQEWQYGRAPFDTLKFRLQDLMPGMTYEAQNRAVDTARPPHLGAWSTLHVWQTSRDIIPPATPAAPMIAASPMSILVQHNLGRADGGEFNLDRDLAHFEVHGAADPLFAPTTDTLLGKMIANWGMITGEVPAVDSFQITSVTPMYFKVVAVDVSGNKSLPSAGVVATAELIDQQYIRSLTVDKVTAGTVSAEWLLGARITTAKTGARVELSSEGIKGFNPANQQLLNWNADNGQLDVIGSKGIRVTGGGNVEITDGALIIYNQDGDKIVEIGECADGRHGIQVYRDTGVRVARIGELSSGSEGIEVINDLGQLVRVDTLAFGTKADTIATSQSTTSTAFAHLATNGPTVDNVIIGNTGRALVFLSCWTLISGSDSATMGFRIIGATIRNAVNDTACSMEGPINAAISRVVLVEGLNPGNHTFQALYRSSFGTSVTFFHRHLAVLPF